jgi:hypothetical protein
VTEKDTSAAIEQGRYFTLIRTSCEIEVSKYSMLYEVSGFTIIKVVVF